MKLKELKSRLKELALFNRQANLKYKDAQRGKITWSDLHAFVVNRPSGNYRHMHIAYSLLRGRKYEQIENKVRPGNEPNWTHVESILQQYREVDEIACSEVICG